MVSAFFSQFAAACSEKTFFGLVPWYHYLNSAGELDSSCNVIQNNDGSFNFTVLGTHSSFLLIALAVVDDLLRIAGVVAVGFVIYAGIRYIMSQGSPDETAKAQSTLVNALIGLVIAMVAVGLVSFVGHQIGTNGGVAPTSGPNVDTSALPHTDVTSNSTIKTVLSITFGIIGGLALLFVTIGGFRYVISQGDPQAVSKAKNTILYALVGLVVAIAAETIVTFVVGRV